MNKEKSIVFGGGIPTAPDVKMLVDAIGIPEEGRMVGYSEIERIIGCRRNTHRFKTVVGAWRRQLRRENNIEMFAVPAEGLQVANPAERIEISHGKVVHGFRSIRRGSGLASTTDRARLTDAEKRQQDHLVTVHAKVMLAQRSVKELPSGE